MHKLNFRSPKTQQENQRVFDEIKRKLNALSTEWEDITGTPTTLAGYGITDALTAAQIAAAYAPLVHSHTFASLTSKPTTLEGYGITDALTSAQIAASYAPISHSHTFASLTAKPTTFAGYGITGHNSYTGTINFDQNYGDGIIGLYVSTRLRMIYGMGWAFRLPTDGNSVTGFYGLAYGYEGYFGIPAGLGHAMGIWQNGVLQSVVGSGLYTVGNIWEQGALLSTRYSNRREALEQIVSLGYTYGSLTITGINTGYAGIRFSAVGRTLMIHPSVQGVYIEATGVWQWYFTNGELVVGSVPFARLTTFPGSAFDVVRGNGTVGKRYFIGCRTVCTTNLTLPAASYVHVIPDLIQEDTESSTSQGGFSGGVFTATVAGKRRVSGNLTFDPTGAGICEFRIYHSGIGWVKSIQEYSTGETVSIPFSVIMYFGAGDWCSVYAYSQSGGIVVGYTGPHYSWIDIENVGI